jgi:tellurite resistance protein TerC
MTVPGWIWTLTLIGLTGLLLADLLIVGRHPRTPTTKESVLWVVFYVTLAVLFGIGIWFTDGASHAGQFYAGWLTEYSLSVDNLFVFVIIMSRFSVPREFQQKVLLIGIVLALVMRGIFIAAGSAVVERFAWMFYIFGAFLLWTAIKLVRHGEDDPSDFKENALIKWSRRALPMTEGYDCPNLTKVQDGKRMFTPLIVVTIALGTTDLLFAFDSIPAIFGLTKVPYLVFTANVFALMGLRQLYFLLGDLLDRLTYLSVGLAVVLGFIGLKLILEALHENNLPFINGGEPLPGVPTVPIWLSLVFIAGTLLVTTALSLVSSRRAAARLAAEGTHARPAVNQ